MNKNNILFIFIVLLFIGCTVDELAPLPKVDDVCTVMNDTIFRNYCHRNYDLNKDGKVSMDEAKNIKSINLYYMSIRSLKGIEYFSGLDTLNCSLNHILTLDVSRCKSLSVLDCSQNLLSSLDVSRCLSLTNLNCSNNHLSSIDISKCLIITSLNCSNNYKLTTLDVSIPKSLVYLYCYYDNLTSLNVTDCNLLKYLMCNNNQLTSLDISRCKALASLNCKYNQLTSINLGTTINASLSNFDCSFNKLSILDVSHCINFYELKCNDNQLTSLDVSSSTVIGYLDCYNNPNLTALWLKTNIHLWLYKDSFTTVYYKN